MRDVYKQLQAPAELQPCPLCFQRSEVWQYAETPDAEVKRVVMCSTYDIFGNGEVLGADCLLHMPPNHFYHDTAKQAVAYWNAYADAINRVRASRSVQS